MTTSEAKQFLSLSDGDSLEDVYEEKVFEWKNFFVNRFPVPSLFRSKIKQLEKLEDAYLVLGGATSGSGNASIELEFSSSFKEAFHQFSQRRSVLKSQLFQSESASTIGSVVQVLIDLTESYARVWNDTELDTAGVVISKEPDPMDLLEAIIDAEKRGVHNISKIDILPMDHMVLNEAKRLSLWTQMSKK